MPISPNSHVPHVGLHAYDTNGNPSIFFSIYNLLAPKWVERSMRTVLFRIIQHEQMSKPINNELQIPLHSQYISIIRFQGIIYSSDHVRGSLNAKWFTWTEVAFTLLVYKLLNCFKGFNDRLAISLSFALNIVIDPPPAYCFLMIPMNVFLFFLWCLKFVV